LAFHGAGSHSANNPEGIYTELRLSKTGQYGLLIGNPAIENSVRKPWLPKARRFNKQNLGIRFSGGQREENEKEVCCGYAR
jgi:hypothetical protein